MGTCLQYSSSVIPQHLEHGLFGKMNLFLLATLVLSLGLTLLPTGSNSSTRNKRFIQFNLDSPINVGFLFVAPFTIVIPRLADNFKFKGRRMTRSLEDLESCNTTLIPDSPIIRPKINKILEIFGLVEIRECSCLQRAICEFSADPLLYHPISTLILDQLADPDLPHIADLEEELEKLGNNPKGVSKSLYRIFSEAEMEGRYGVQACEVKYHAHCPYQVHHRLDMESLDTWSTLSNTLGISLQENTS